MRVTLLSACQAAVVALCLAGPAFAQAPRKVRFEYARQDGATACPDLARVQAGVAARLGYEPFDDLADDLVRATIHSSGHGLEARIEMADAKGSPKAERRLVSFQRDCAELASAVELAVSIAIDPFRRAQPAVRLTDQPASPSKPGRPLSGRAEAGIVGGLGTAPSRTIGVAAGAAIRGGDLSLGIEGRADLPASTSLRVGEASASLLVASLVPCAHFRMVATCALATAGALRASGHGLVDARKVTLPYVALGARLAVAIPLTTRLSVALHGDLTTPLTETQLQVDGATVWTSPILSLALGIGVAATFP